MLRQHADHATIGDHQYALALGQFLTAAAKPLKYAVVMPLWVRLVAHRSSSDPSQPHLADAVFSHHFVDQLVFPFAKMNFR